MTTLRRCLTALAATSLLAGCATAGDPCVGATPIRPDRGDVDVISDSLAGQLLEHNR